MPKSVSSKESIYISLHEYALRHNIFRIKTKVCFFIVLALITGQVPDMSLSKLLHGEGEAMQAVITSCEIYATHLYLSLLLLLLSICSFFFSFLLYVSISALFLLSVQKSEVCENDDIYKSLTSPFAQTVDRRGNGAW